MELNSCLYRCEVVHKRYIPRKHQFSYPHISFLLDLDELDLLSKRLSLFSHNGFGFYNFRDQDHLDEGEEPLKIRLGRLLKEQGIGENLGRVFLLANPRVCGYVFNPLSVYYCFAQDKRPVAVVMEVCNTFRERKAYVIKADTDVITERQVKNFYISPFCRVDDELLFKADLPSEQLRVDVTTFSGEDKVIWSGLSGKRLKLSNRSLIYYSLLFPLVTYAVIARIHLQALFLWLKKVPFFRKEEMPEMQTGLWRPHGQTGIIESSPRKQSQVRR